MYPCILDIRRSPSNQHKRPRTLSPERRLQRQAKIFGISRHFSQAQLFPSIIKAASIDVGSRPQLLHFYTAHAKASDRIMAVPADLGFAFDKLSTTGAFLHAA